MDQKQSCLKSTVTPALCQDLVLVESMLALLQGREKRRGLGRKPRREAAFGPDLEELRELRSIEDQSHPWGSAKLSVDTCPEKAGPSSQGPTAAANVTRSSLQHGH